MKPIIARVPGKLLLAGEYAILSPGALALVLAVNRYLEVELHSAGRFEIESELWPQPWAFDSLEQAALEAAPEPLQLVAKALYLGAEYLGERLQLDGPFRLQLRSQLHEAQVKAGLGSSSAACVGVLAALFARCGENLALFETKVRLYRLAVLAHRQVQKQGSGADIAGHIFGSVTAYTSPDFQALPYGVPLKELIDHKKWPLLDLQHLAWPEELRLDVGWTGQPAYSPDYIALYKEWREKAPELEGEFLFQANTASLALLQAVREGAIAPLIAGIARAQRALLFLDQELPEAIETHTLQALVRAAVELGGAGKLSGAGGGDCGIALVPEHERERLHQAWERAGIQPLELLLDSQGVSCA